MERHRGMWVVVADGRSARLLRLEMASNGRCHAQEHERLRVEREARESSRFSMRSSPAVEAGDRLRKWARQLGAWMQWATGRYRIRKLALISRPPILDAVGSTEAASPVRLIEHEEDLVGMRTGELAAHPVLRDVLGAVRVLQQAETVG